MARGAVHVEGLQGLLRAFNAADKTVKEDLRDALMEAAAPVRSEAQRRAGAFTHVGGSHKPWAGMRIGAYSAIVYVAPVERGVKGRGNERLRRPRFGTKLLEQAMEPALANNSREVEQRLDGVLDEVADVWERTPGDGT